MVTAPRWTEAAPPFRRRVLIVAPHPDDEVLGCAGIMRWLDAAGLTVEIVAVTDGDASHARSSRVTPQRLVEIRAAERTAALSALGLEHLSVHRLGFQDGDVASMEHELVRALLVEGHTTLVVPWRHDGHPDHEAVGRAGMAAAIAAGAACVEVPIWSRVRGRRFQPSHVLELGSLHSTKCAAVSEFVSQLVAWGPDPVDGPVVHPEELQRLTSSTELAGAR